ncbi:MAG: DNA mismatch repair protein MutS [Spirochaetaceae bacterium]|nr:DNA mismatch repair protein MutS [Spirochaetaceae bacterium]
MNKTDSPMIVQYRRIKSEHTDEVLFFRLGDFYEMFAEDALEVSKLLNLTLTQRNNLPMCGIPYHSSHAYIARLLKFGKKIAICEQMGDSSKEHPLIEREVVETISPGTTVDEDFLEKDSGNYLACLYNTEKSFSFSYIELSCGEFCATSFPVEGAEQRVRQELERIDVKEIIVQESILNDTPEIARILSEKTGLVLNRWTDWLFDAQQSLKRLLKQLGAESLKGFGLDDNSPEIISAGALLEYLEKTSKSLLPHIRRIKIYGDEEYLGLDASTFRNLEVIHNLNDGGSDYTLLSVIDKTKTAMGRRLLRKRIAHPLVDKEKIEKRLEMVDYFFKNQALLSELRQILSAAPDLERQRSRLAMNKSHGKDMVSLKTALESLEKLDSLLESATQDAATGGAKDGENTTFVLEFESDEACFYQKSTSKELLELKNQLENAMEENPSVLLTEGNLIKRGFNTELDALHSISGSGRALLQEYLESERQKTGINNLKINYNRLIGYFFEVSQTQSPKIPDYFIKRQSLVAAERYSTEKLASLESQINGAHEKIVEFERRLFLELREAAKKHLPSLSAAAARIAEIDVASGLARAAGVHRWVKPHINNSLELTVKDGRHPVVEAHLARGEFIPNDLILHSGEADESGGTDDSFMLITGPNMAGKSTYLRQAALITLLAQTGSFVPAREADVGIVDRIYCRVGASDNLARGESTFFVEMSETSFILNTATERSLVIMDEVGRGTSAKDGLAIAQAVCENLLDKIKCRTLFATHYYELTFLEHPRMINCSLLVDDSSGEIVFCRKLIRGAAQQSYGLHVARLAGLPEDVLVRAEFLMQQNESGEKQQMQTSLQKAARQKIKKQKDLGEPSLFDETFE